MEHHSFCGPTTVNLQTITNAYLKAFLLASQKYNYEPNLMWNFTSINLHLLFCRSHTNAAWLESAWQTTGCHSCCWCVLSAPEEARNVRWAAPSIQRIAYSRSHPASLFDKHAVLKIRHWWIYWHKKSRYLQVHLHVLSQKNILQWWELGNVDVLVSNKSISTVV